MREILRSAVENVSSVETQFPQSLNQIIGVKIRDYIPILNPTFPAPKASLSHPPLLLQIFNKKS